MFQLTDTRSSDRRLSVLHYIAQTMQDKFPELLNFDQELQYIEKASVGEKQHISILNRAEIYRMNVPFSLMKFFLPSAEL